MQRCFDNAEVIARILEAEPEVMHDVHKMRALAEQMEVDEIHIFSSAGVIFAGTTPEYFGLTMEPVNVMEATEKNELVYIFSLLRVNPNAHYYAIDVSNGEITASTDLDSLGKHYEELGFDINKIKNDANGFHATVSGRAYYCVFEQIDTRGLISRCTLLFIEFQSFFQIPFHSHHLFWLLYHF